MFVWGRKSRSVPDAVTLDRDYTCPRCDYRGRLLLYEAQKKTTVYFVPVGGWRSAGGVMVCPSCGHQFDLSRRKYGELAKIHSGPELAQAHAEIRRQIERPKQLPGGARPSLSAQDEMDVVRYDLSDYERESRQRIKGALRDSGIRYAVRGKYLVVSSDDEVEVDDLIDSLFGDD